VIRWFWRQFWLAFWDVALAYAAVLQKKREEELLALARKFTGTQAGKES